MQFKLSHFQPSVPFHPPPIPVNPRSFFFLSTGSPNILILSSGRLCDIFRQSSSVMKGEVVVGGVGVAEVVAAAGLCMGMGASLLMSARRSTVGAGVAVALAVAVAMSGVAVWMAALVSASMGGVDEALLLPVVVVSVARPSTASNGGNESDLSMGGASSGGGASMATSC